MTTKKDVNKQRMTLQEVNTKRKLPVYLLYAKLFYNIDVTLHTIWRKHVAMLVCIGILKHECPYNSLFYCLDAF